MQRHLDVSLEEMHQILLTMSGYVVTAIDAATLAWQTRDVEKTRLVYEIEDKVNHSHIELDAACFQLLALHQPVAADLRTVVAAIKINNDLERMVDLAVNIANNTEYYLKKPPLIHVTDLTQISDEVKIMVRGVLEAFVKTDTTLAEEILTRDDKVDQLKQKILQDVTQAMRKNPDAIEQGLNIILIAKNLERIGDHATNIAEDVIFTASGKDIRHSGDVTHLTET